jgi:hypothetical protein
VTFLKQLLFSVFGRELHWVKLAGSLIALVALLQVISSLALMSDSWDALNNFNHCSPTDSGVCSEALYRITDVQVWAGQAKVDFSQAIRVFVGPVAQLFGWLVIMIIGWLLYRSPMVKVRESEEPVHVHKKKP